jgi:hypothetical protein
MHIVPAAEAAKRCDERGKTAGRRQAITAKVGAPGRKRLFYERSCGTDRLRGLFLIVQ